MNLHRFELALLALAIAAANSAAFAPPLQIPTKHQLYVEGLSIRRRLQQCKDKRRRRANLRSSPVASDGNHREYNKTRHYIRPYLKQLFLLCRPINFPVVVLFHALGVYQAVQLWQSASMLSSSSPILLPLLKHPSILMVLLSLLLVTSTSMITNDYYDARNGVDSSIDNKNNGNNASGDYHPLAKGEVPFSVTKRFDSYLYAILLLSSAFVPGVISRLMVLGGAIITYLYTVHLKPKTWIKNLSCAALVSMSPVTSGLAAWFVLCEGAFLKSLGSTGVETATAASTIPFHLIFKSPLSFLVVSLFAGIMSREILMDITDCEGDAQAGIETVPVRYGRSAAASVALGCSFISAISVCGASMIPLSQGLVEVGRSTRITIPRTRKVILSVVGSGLLLLRTFSVWRTGGENTNVAERAISEGLISVLLVLASFL